MRSGTRRLAANLLHDLAMAAAAFLLALYLRLGDELFEWPRETVLGGLAIFVAVACAVFPWMGLHRIVWRYASVGDLGRILRAAVLTVALFVACQFAYNRLADFPRSFLVIEVFVLTGLLAGPRLLHRLVRDGELSALLDRRAGDRVPVLLVGAGDGADLFVREMARGREAPYRAVGIVDDRDARVGRSIRGVPVLGGLDDLEKTVAGLRRAGTAPRRLVITSREIDGATVRRIVAAADALGVPAARLPRLDALDRADGGPAGLAPRPIDVEDVLGRAQAALDPAPVRRLIAGRRVLITGAGGTIGGELARQAAALAPASLALLDASEYLLYRIDREVAERAPGVERRALIGDVRDRARVAEAMAGVRPDIVLHAAALKHVPLVEANPLEGVLVNAVGARNVADAARAAGAGTMVLISTDKAADPENTMGAAKRAAELYCQAMDAAGAAEGPGATRFAVVRFGNVLGSSGSVIPLFQSQIAAGGPVTVTHPEMTRYFMTVREAVALVLRAAALARNGAAGGAGPAGGIFVLDMGEPVNILDLARQMIRLSGLSPGDGVEIAFTGPRPGEKLREALAGAGETLAETAVPAIRAVAPRAAGLEVPVRAFDALEDAARRRDAPAALAELRRLVPEFRPPGDSGEA